MVVAPVTALAALAALAVVPAGCGGGVAPTPTTPLVREAPPTPDPPPDRIARADQPGGPGDGDGPDEDGLDVSSTRGSVDPTVVSARLQPRASAIEACYASQVGRRKWLGGGVELTWDVAADGAIRSVALASSDLGAWPIEKCVLGVARTVSFGVPRGNKPARVTAPVSFSSGSGAVRWDQAKTDKAVGPRLVKLAPCAAGGAAPTDVTITMYLGTRGKVQAVGFASPRGFAEAWADCAERAILAWSLTDPRGKVAKLSITFNPSSDGGGDDADDADRDL